MLANHREGVVTLEFSEFYLRPKFSKGKSNFRNGNALDLYENLIKFLFLLKHLFNSRINVLLWNPLPHWEISNVNKNLIKVISL